MKRIVEKNVTLRTSHIEQEVKRPLNDHESGRNATGTPQHRPPPDTPRQRKHWALKERKRPAPRAHSSVRFIGTSFERGVKVFQGLRVHKINIIGTIRAGT